MRFFFFFKCIGQWFTRLTLKLGCGYGVQVFHESLEIRHLLVQLLGAVGRLRKERDHTLKCYCPKRDTLPRIVISRGNRRVENRLYRYELDFLYFVENAVKMNW